MMLTIEQIREKAQRLRPYLEAITQSGPGASIIIHINYTKRRRKYRIDCDYDGKFRVYGGRGDFLHVTADLKDAIDFVLI